MNELEWCFRPTFRRHRAQDSRSPTRFGILDPTVHQCRQIMLILLIMTVFWWCRRHSGRGHSREGWAWWATHTTVSTADELAGSGWKWMEVDGSEPWRWTGCASFSKEDWNAGAIHVEHFMICANMSFWMHSQRAFSSSMSVWKWDQTLTECIFKSTWPVYGFYLTVFKRYI